MKTNNILTPEQDDFMMRILDQVAEEMERGMPPEVTSKYYDSRVVDTTKKAPDFALK